MIKERSEEEETRELLELQRLADFNGQSPQAQRRWSAPRSRHNSLGSGTPPYTASPRLSATVGSAGDQLVVDVEQMRDKVGALGTKHQLLAETVTELQNRLIELEKERGVVGSTPPAIACCALF